MGPLQGCPCPLFGYPDRPGRGLIFHLGFHSGRSSLQVMQLIYSGQSLMSLGTHCALPIRVFPQDSIPFAPIPLQVIPQDVILVEPILLIAAPLEIITCEDMPLVIILLEMFPLSIIQLEVELAKNVSDGCGNQTVLASMLL